MGRSCGLFCWPLVCWCWCWCRCWSSVWSAGLLVCWSVCVWGDGSGHLSRCRCCVSSRACHACAFVVLSLYLSRFRLSLSLNRIRRSLSVEGMGSRAGVLLSESLYLCLCPSDHVPVPVRVDAFKINVDGMLEAGSTTSERSGGSPSPTRAVSKMSSRDNGRGLGARV